MANAEHGAPAPRLPNFIEDVAASVDAFGAHDRIARAVAKLINSNTSFKVIGLLGPWGSGKSTVSQLIEKEVVQSASKKRIYFFTYDTWLHQSDPPRRAFLEALIYFLIRNGLTTKPEWAGELDELSRRVEKSESTSTPTLTNSGRLIGAALLLVPIGLPFIGYEWFSTTFGNNWLERYFDIELPMAAKFIFPFALALTLSPLIVALTLYFSWRPKAPFFSKDYWRTHKPPFDGSSILTIFTNKEVEKKSITITRGVDPTAIEFQSPFRKIIARCSSDNPRFVFVIDNLDRLPEADAIAMWSTIRSFFLGGGELDDAIPEPDLPIILLPIDERAVERMYAARLSDPQLAGGLAQSFMDKTFDLTFRIPPPVLSDWSGYFDRQMQFVFDDLLTDEDRFNATTILRQHLTSSVSIDVTPRFINTLINLVGTLWMQWSEQIPFCTIVYFCIHRAAIEESLLGEFGRPKAGIESIDAKWQQHLAAVHYGVATLSDAMQIVMEAPLLAAITDNEPNEFAQLALINGFEWSLETTLDGVLSGGVPDVQFALHASALLSSLPAKKVWLKRQGGKIRKIFTTAAPWRNFQFDPDLLKGFLDTIEQSDAKVISANVAEKLSGIDPVQFADAKATVIFARALTVLAEFAQSHNLALPKVSVPGDAGVFLQVLPLLGAEKATLQMAVPKATEAQILQELVGGLTTAQQAEHLARKVGALLDRDTKLDWATFAEALFQVAVDRPVTDFAVAPALEALGLMRQAQKSAQAAVKARIDSGQLSTVLANAFANNAEPVVVRLIGLLLASGPAAGTAVPAEGGWTGFIAKHTTFVGEADAALRRFYAPTTLQLLVSAVRTDASFEPLVRALFAERIAADSLGSLPLSNVLSQLPTYLAYVADADKDKFIHMLAGYDSFWTILGDAPLTEPVATILRSLMGRDEKAATTAADAVKIKLEGRSEEEWCQTVATGGIAMDLAEMLSIRYPTLMPLAGSLYSALENRRSSLMSADAPTVSRWFSLAAMTGEASCRILHINLRDTVFESAPDNNSYNMLAATPDDFLERGQFYEKPDDAIRHVILPLLMDEAGRSWLRQNAAITARWVNDAKSDGPARMALVERLNAPPDEAVGKSFEELRTAWSLPKPPPPPPPKSSEVELDGALEKDGGPPKA